MEKAKKIVINCEPKELDEILGKDFLNVNDVIYFKKSRVLQFCENFVKHLEKNGKIKILKDENKIGDQKDSEL